MQQWSVTNTWDIHTSRRTYCCYNKEKAAPKPQEKKDPIKTKEKKIVYKLAESSSSDSSDEEEVVYVKKVKNKKEHKKQIYHQPENREILDSTLYKSSQELLHKEQ